MKCFQWVHTLVPCQTFTSKFCAKLNHDISLCCIVRRNHVSEEGLRTEMSCGQSVEPKVLLPQCSTTTCMTTLHCMYMYIWLFMQGRVKWWSFQRIPTWTFGPALLKARNGPIVSVDSERWKEEKSIESKGKEEGRVWPSFSRWSLSVCVCAMPLMGSINPVQPGFKC